MYDLTIKKGDTFAFIAAISSNNAPLTGASDKLSSQVKNFKGAVVSDMTVSETETQGSYLFRTNTDLWKEDTVLFFDIKYTDNDIVSSTNETISVFVKR
jgi:hypothetical protein